MSRTKNERAKKPVPSRAVKAQALWRLRTKLLLCLGVAVLGAAIAGISVLWDQRHTVPSEKFVKVYREHGCTCVFAWVRSLEAEGYTVRVFEPETLQITRSALHMPKRSWGCHVAEFMGYFVEGHVPVRVLEQIARQHPRALGVALAATETAPADSPMNTAVNSEILLFDNAGNAHRWEFPGAADHGAERL